MILISIKIFLCFLGAAISFWFINQQDNIGRYKLIYIISFGFICRWVFLASWFFFFDGHTSGDIQGYESHIRMILEGLVPNRNFSSPYGFYFYYILSLPYKLFSNPIIIIATIHLFELLGVLFFCKAITRCLSVDKANLFAILYVTNPLVISWFSFDGQDEAMLIFAYGGIFFASVISSPVLKAFYSGFSIFAVKITGIAAVISLLIVARLKDRTIILFVLCLFLLLPLILGSQVLGFQFEREGSSDELLKTILPGNIWYFFNKTLSSDKIFFWSPIILILFFLANTVLLFRLVGKINEITFLSSGATLYTISYQIGSFYTTPGFVATIVPFLIFLLLTNNKFIKKNFYFFIIYSFVVSFDTVVYFRLYNGNDYNLVGYDSVLFNVYVLAIVFLNVTIYFFLLRYLFQRLKPF